MPRRQEVAFQENNQLERPSRRPADLGSNQKNCLKQEEFRARQEEFRAKFGFCVKSREAMSLPRQFVESCGVAISQSGAAKLPKSHAACASPAESAEIICVVITSLVQIVRGRRIH